MHSYLDVFTRAMRLELAPERVADNRSRESKLGAAIGRLALRVIIIGEQLAEQRRVAGARRDTLDALRHLDDRLLNDIGLSRSNLAEQIDAATRAGTRARKSTFEA